MNNYNNQFILPILLIAAEDWKKNINRDACARHEPSTNTMKQSPVRVGVSS